MLVLACDVAAMAYGGQVQVGSRATQTIAMANQSALPRPNITHT